MSKKLEKGGEGVSEKGEEVGRKGILRVSFSSHSLPVLFSSRKILETPAKQATHSKAENFLDYRDVTVFAKPSPVYTDAFSFVNAYFLLRFCPSFTL